MRSLLDVEQQILANFGDRLVASLESQVGDSDSALAAIGIEPQSLQRGEVSPDEFLELLHVLNQSEDLAGLCLRYGISREIFDLGLIGYAILSCSDIGGAIDVACRYHRLTSSIDQIYKTETNNRVVVTLRVRPAHRPMQVEIAEEFVTGQWKLLTDLLPPEFDRREIGLDFAFPPPAYADLCYELMPGALRYDAPSTSLSFPAEWQPLAIATADATVEQVCRAQCDELLESFEPGRPIVDDLRRIILSVPTNRAPLLEDAAHALAMSPRTLERRLHQEGLNFRQIANEIRMGVAAQYIVLATASGQELSAMLGYSQPSAFYRAFRNWFGMTPKQYRYSRLLSRPNRV
jgi:AraC-like DNA-binding protein